MTAWRGGCIGLHPSPPGSATPAALVRARGRSAHRTGTRRGASPGRMTGELLAVVAVGQLGGRSVHLLPDLLDHPCLEAPVASEGDDAPDQALVGPTAHRLWRNLQDLR